MHIVPKNGVRQTVKLTLTSSGRNPSEPICSVRSIERTKPPTYLFSKPSMSKSVGDKNQPAASSIAMTRPPACSRLFFQLPSVTAVPSTAAVSSASVSRYLRRPDKDRKREIQKYVTEIRFPFRASKTGLIFLRKAWCSLAGSNVFACLPHLFSCHCQANLAHPSRAVAGIASFRGDFRRVT